MDVSNLKLAAIDIGSNAIRFQVSQVIDNGGIPFFKRLEYVRFPLRLGKDVFTGHRIGRKTEEKFVRLMQSFSILLDLFEVDDYMICATSAMREAENAEEIVQRVYYQHGLKINIIDGNREADLINLSIRNFIDHRDCVHIDVGGGSTELNVYQKKEKIAAKSYKLGSVRMLNEQSTQQTFEKMQSWLQKKTEGLSKDRIAIGTGGNINKLFELAGIRDVNEISYEKLVEIRDYVASFSFRDRVMKLMLNDDRADVIIPASEIYLRAMQMTGCKKIVVPNMGLKDGMIMLLYQNIIAPVVLPDRDDSKEID